MRRRLLRSPSSGLWRSGWTSTATFHPLEIIPPYPFPVYDLVTMEDEIEWVVTQLQKHRSRGPSGMREEHQKGWLEEARKR